MGTAGRPIIDLTRRGEFGRETYAKRRRLGRCTSCGIRRTRGRSLCPRCRRASVATQADLRKRRRAKGACQECGKPADFRARCPKCARRRNRRRSRSREARTAEYKRENLRRKRKRRLWRQRRRCVRCGARRSRLGGSLCDMHRTARSDARARRTEIARAARRAVREVLEARLGDLSLGQAAVIIGISPVSLARFCDRGRLECGWIGKHRRFHRADVLAFKQERDAHPERQRTGRKQAT